MATITEDYVSFETAKLLKEKGFKTELTTFYYSNGMFSHGNTYSFVNNELKINPDIILAPSLALAMKWLREVHNLFIEIIVGESEGKTWYDYDILPVNGKFIYWKELDVLPPTVECNTPENAIEVGLKYCLEHLI